MERTGSSGKEKTGVGGTEGGRSPTGVPPTPVAAARTGEVTAGPRPDPEVREKPVRRTFTAEYKRRILEEADRCTRPGELGALLRREGLYSSHLLILGLAASGGLSPLPRCDVVWLQAIAIICAFLCGVCVVGIAAAC